VPDKNQDPPPQWALDIQNKLAALKTFQALRKITLSATPTDENEENQASAFSRVTGTRRVGLTDFAANLRKMVTLSRAAGAEPLILIPPVASLGLYLPNVPSSPFHDLHREYQATARRVAAEAHCTLIDLQKLFDERADLFDYPVEDPVHFNGAGHGIVSGSILLAIDSLSAQ